MAVPTSLFQQAARLNNEGVGFLAAGNHVWAIEAMTKAIQLINAHFLLKRERSAIKPISATSSSSSCRQEDYNTSPNIRCTFLHINTTMKIDNATRSIPGITCPTTFGAHSYAIQMFLSSKHAATRTTTADLLSGGEQAGPSTSESDMIVCSSTIIYNIAFAHHLQACSSSSASGKKVRARAERFYNLVLKQLGNYQDVCLDEYIVLVVKLACVNNLCHIHYDRGDYKQARRHGLRLLSSHVFRHTASRHQAMFSKPMVRRLLVNILILVAKEPNVAAAA